MTGKLSAADMATLLESVNTGGFSFTKNADGTYSIVPKLSNADGAALVSLNGAVTAVVADWFTRIMSANDATSWSGSSNENVILDSTGLKAFSAKLLGTLTAGDYVIVAWSTTANDQTALKALMDSVSSDLNAAVGSRSGLNITNVLVLSGITEHTVFFDGVNKIKTLTVMSSDATVDYSVAIGIGA